MSVINTNLTALKGQSNMSRAQGKLSTAMERLSSGMRVNGAKDDAAGQSIGNRFQAQRSGLGQAARNANDGISMSKTAQGVLDSVNDKLQRVRELTVQGLNSGTLSTRDGDAIQAEINQNLQEIDRLAKSSQYNGIPLMTGQAGRVDLQVGANDGQTLGLDLSPPGFTVDALGLTDFNVAGEPGSVTPRDTLFGPADDIVLEDSRTTVNYPQGAEPVLYALGDVSLAGDHKREGDAIINYYVSKGDGNFSRVNVSATHETATDLSVVNITDPQPIYKTDWYLDPTAIGGLQPNQSVVQAGSTYYVETENANGSLSYQEVEFDISFTGTSAPVASVRTMDPPPVDYQKPQTFEFGGEEYELSEFRDVFYQSASGDTLDSASTRLVEDGINPGAFYLEDTSSGEALYYRLSDIEIKDNLDVSLSQNPVNLSFGNSVDEFEVDGESYDPEDTDYDEVLYTTPGGQSIVAEDIIRSHEDDNFYIVDDQGNYYRIESASEVGDPDDPDSSFNLEVSISNAVTLSFGDEVESFQVDGDEYELSDYDAVVWDSAGNEITLEKVIKSHEDGTFYAVSSDGDYFEIEGAEASQDLTLEADSQAYTGADVESRNSPFDDNVSSTPEVLDFSPASPTFTGDFSDIDGGKELMRSTGNNEWIIRGDLPDGGFGYYTANLTVTLNTQGQPARYEATSTQPGDSPTILGVEEHEVEKVHGISTVTIDPRNVSVEYTDVEGRVYSNVLTEGEDGNYYFEIPGESAIWGNFKTATLVDHDQKGEIILRTENGLSEVVVFYPTELEKGVNRAFFVQTDANGFNDDGTPHTRLRIQEAGEDFRIQMPRNPLAALDKAIDMVDSKRSYLGSLDNRLDAVINSNEALAVNIADARSRIMDADYAVETANMLKIQVLQQAGTSMLAQANVMPETVLALLD